MAGTRINLNQLPGYIEDRLEELVQEAGVFLEGRLVTLSPTDTGTFKKNWQRRRDGLDFLSFNATQGYAEAITFGVNMPPSWQGQFRSKFGLPQAWPDKLAGEETKAQIPKIWNRIVRRS